MRRNSVAGKSYLKYDGISVVGSDTTIAMQRATELGRFTIVLARTFLTRAYETMNQPTSRIMVIAIADSSSDRLVILEKLSVRIWNPGH